MPRTRSDVEIRLEPCDVFLTRGTSLVSKAIRFFTRQAGEPPTKVNHVGIIVGEGSLWDAPAVEALSKVRRHPLGRYAGKARTGLAVYRPINLTPAEKAAIVEKAESYVGRKYGVIKIAAHLLDWVFQGAYVFRRLANMDEYPICSWLVAHSFGAAGKHFGVLSGAATPDDIWDFVTDEEDKYEMVRELAPLGAEPAPAMEPVMSTG